MYAGSVAVSGDKIIRCALFFAGKRGLLDWMLVVGKRKRKTKKREKRQRVVGEAEKPEKGGL